MSFSRRSLEGFVYMCYWVINIYLHTCVLSCSVFILRNVDMFTGNEKCEQKCGKVCLIEKGKVVYQLLICVYVWPAW